MGSYIGKSDSMKETLALLYAGLENQVPVILWGPPGIGKTELVKALAKRAKLPLFILLLSVMDPTDVSGIPTIKTVERHDPITGKVETYRITEPALNHWADELIREGKGILFLDEASNGTPAVQATVLSMLQGRTVGHVTLPDEVWMIAAANGEDQAADGWTLAPPMANRFLHIDFMVDLVDWVNGMICNWADPVPQEGTQLHKRYMNLLRQRTEIAGFVKENSDFLIKVPEDPAEAGRAWPSPRSWDAAARILSGIPKAEATSNIRYKALLGLVGSAATTQYKKYEEEMRLPAYDKVLASPEDINWTEISASEQRLTLDMVVGMMSRDNAKASTNVMQVFIEKTNRTDLVASIADDFSERMQTIGLSATPEGAAMIGTIYRITNSAARGANLSLGTPNTPVRPPRLPQRKP